jgi:hypothetical protein
MGAGSHRMETCQGKIAPFLTRFWPGPRSLPCRRSGFTPPPGEVAAFALAGGDIQHKWIEEIRQKRAGLPSAARAECLRRDGFHDGIDRSGRDDARQAPAGGSQ